MGEDPRGENPWSDWVGRTQTGADVITPSPARALAATLDDDARFEAGDVLPFPWIWLYFLPLAPMAQVGPDGHPQRGGFLPPVDLPRRMWAGSRCTFHAPIRIDDAVERTSTIAKVSQKPGKTGPMVFVTVRHAVSAGGVLAMEEEQDLVFIDIPDRFVPPEPVPLPACDWSRPVGIDPVFLFRVSALTFNGHRIHYDRTYATEVERYPGLVVHGPLQAVLLFHAAARAAPGRTAARFSFRGVRPLFDFERVSVNGRARDGGGLDLFTANGDGLVGMKAEIDWAPA
jgi:3-methylfumaryl-CoA hydratase